MTQEPFILTRNTRVETKLDTEPVRRAILRFYRDLEMTLLEEGEPEEGGIIELRTGKMQPEEFKIQAENSRRLALTAGGDLGFVYGLLYLSRNFLGILPFWFWNDQKFQKKPFAAIPAEEIHWEDRRVAFRGWFINDEVLITHWDGGKDREYPWEMAFEALLRCGGNTVIPGTDSNARKHEGLAASMGLWIAQHHSQPLGAEMFLRAYPDLEPSFRKYPELFRGLWEEGVKRQMGEKVIWNIGFRGQGDVPFWENDPEYDTPEKRGELINHIMEEQCRIVQKYVKEPVFSLNLYGEILEMYRQGFLRLPEHVILIWGDNGYGKMVSRRQENHNPRVPALPEKGERDGLHGLYYHVSFYDLQAANVLTMLPNSMEFVEKELGAAYDSGIKTLWIINCSNIKPHVYPLDFVSSLWNQKSKKAEGHLEQYLRDYYGDCRLEEMKECFRGYFQAAIPYGREEDEHAGEQFYNYITRVFIHHWMKDGGKERCGELIWCGPMDSFGEQLRWFADLCGKAVYRYTCLLRRCEELAGRLSPEAGRLWRDSILLQVQIHAFCQEGVCRFGRAYEAFEKQDLMRAFYEAGRAAEYFDRADQAMKECCHGKWKGFYDNDCQTDVKETAYLLRLLMGYIRNLGDGPYFYHWQRKVIYPKKDQKIMLLLNFENHMTDEALYQAMREKRYY